MKRSLTLWNGIRENVSFRHTESLFNHCKFCHQPGGWPQQQKKLPNLFSREYQHKRLKDQGVYVHPCRGWPNNILCSLIRSASCNSEECWQRSWWISHLLSIETTGSGQEGVWTRLCWFRFVEWKRHLCMRQVGTERNCSTSQESTHSISAKLLGAINASEPIANVLRGFWLCPACVGMHIVRVAEAPWVSDVIQNRNFF